MPTSSSHRCEYVEHPDVDRRLYCKHCGYPPQRERERIKINRHGERMRLARVKYGTHLICPDCYIPHKHGHCPKWRDA